MFMFVPKFNFLIICENMKKSLNNKNHFPFFHCHLIVIFFTWSYTLTILLLPSGEATCRWLFLQGNTIIIVPVKDMVFLEMLWGERSTRKKKIFSWSAGIGHFLQKCPFYLNWWKVFSEQLTHTCIWNPFSQALHNVIF